MYFISSYKNSFLFVVLGQTQRLSLWRVQSNWTGFFFFVSLVDLGKKSNNKVFHSSMLIKVMSSSEWWQRANTIIHEQDCSFVGTQALTEPDLPGERAESQTRATSVARTPPVHSWKRAERPCKLNS